LRAFRAPERFDLSSGWLRAALPFLPTSFATARRRMGGSLSAPWHALSRAGALPRDAPPTPVSCPRYRQAGAGSPLRALWHRGCPPRAGAAGPSNGASHCLAGQDHRQDLLAVASPRRSAQAPPLEQ
jgi:hypothetical protein